ncbi:UdgX family uracil-DNA binding protein [Telluria aromaticivorans]|uniref:Type-4 uracil-DNA glycosylase n=1 Tax=Telluria aromaticivorans TaxID=2725995 RepID=A0A7Y2P2N2_9BURK|nr:UdgX family uracil-DNA binding protein [Telluria aromaticivorans]NNG25124.1 UdgX family uracil-DNA binding protein [Telluria aromaticivorans]
MNEPAAVTAAANGQLLQVNSFGEWRTAARELLRAGVPPEAVTWGTLDSNGSGDLFSGAPAPGGQTHSQAIPTQQAQPPKQAATVVPRSLLDMLQKAAGFRAPDRWAFLYRVLWRWQQGEHDVQSPADPDGSRLHGMAKAVRREEHDMHAYIRFRERPIEAGAPRFVAWFEPAHDVLPQVAEHFVARMGKTSWMIATPEASVLWDGATLHNTGPLMSSAADLDDAGEALWLTYYRSIFNPARVNAQLMQSHIPSRFWKNLPEGAIVPSMVSQAELGARKIGQVDTVGRKSGATIPITAEKAQPDREQPSKLDECRRCELWQYATQAVPGEGPRGSKGGAPIMVVGEQPGDQEDLAGKPFVGPAGKLLDRVFAQAEVDRKSIYLTNAVKHFKWEPKGKRRIHKTPAQREVEACHYWLEKELDAVRPKVIVAMGSTALKSVLGRSTVTLKDTLGKSVRHEGRWVVTIYHPSYVLRVPDEAARQEAFSIMVKGLKLAHELLEQPDVPGPD